MARKTDGERRHAKMFGRLRAALAENAALCDQLHAARIENARLTKLLREAGVAAGARRPAGAGFSGAGRAG